MPRWKPLNMKAAKQRFVRRIQKTDSCWLWTGKKNPAGYGYFYLRPGVQQAHRVAVEFWGGGVPAGSVVLHTCDNPGCVNPAHLRVGTQRDNIRDCMAKGRNTPPPPRRKLTPEQVGELAASTDRTCDLMRKYGISREHVRRLRGTRAAACARVVEICTPPYGAKTS